jgi:uncharacterized protein YggE
MKERTITVRGTGNVSAKPDLIVIEMKLDTIMPDYAATLETATAEIDALRSALVAAGHDGKELKTTNFNIQTKFEGYKVKDEWKQRFVGYDCSHSLRLEFDFDMPILGKTLGAIATCAVDPQFNIRFTVKNPAAVKELLLESAVVNATEKANILAKSAGVKLGAIKQIDYSWGELRLYSETDMMVCEAAAPKAMGIEIEPEDINASDNVTIVWEIE